MLPRLHGKRLLFRLNAAPVHANHANRASAFAVSRIIDPSRLADPQAFVNPDYFASDSTKPDYALGIAAHSKAYSRDEVGAPHSGAGASSRSGLCVLCRGGYRRCLQRRITTWA